MIQLFHEHPIWWGFVLMVCVYFVCQGIVYAIQAYKSGEGSEL